MKWKEGGGNTLKRNTWILEQWPSTRGALAPEETFGSIWTLLLGKTRVGQTCYEIPYDARHSPPFRRITQPSVRSAGVENPRTRGVPAVTR